MISKFLNDRIILKEYNEQSVISEIALYVRMIDKNNLVHKAIAEAKKLYPNNTYHNFTHAILVARYCAAFFKEYKIPPEEAMYVIIGAIFHDAMHSGVKLYTDKFNVKASVYYCVKFLKRNKAPQAGITIARSSIENTEYSNGEFKQERLRYHALIRDADLVGSMIYDVHITLLEGLFSELNMPNSLSSLCDNLIFLNSCEFNHKNADEIYSHFSDRIIEEVEIYNEKRHTKS